MGDAPRVMRGPRLKRFPRGGGALAGPSPGKNGFPEARLQKVHVHACLLGAQLLSPPPATAPSGAPLHHERRLLPSRVGHDVRVQLLRCRGSLQLSRRTALARPELLLNERVVHCL